MGRHGKPYNSSAEFRGHEPSRHPYLQGQPAPQSPSGHPYAAPARNEQHTAAEMAAVDADYAVRLDERFGPDAGTKGFLLNPDWIRRARERNPHADHALAQQGLPSLEEAIIPGSEGPLRMAPYTHQVEGEIARPEDATVPYPTQVGKKYGFLANPDYVDYYNKNRAYDESRLEPGMVVDERFAPAGEQPHPQQPPADTFNMPIEYV